MATYTPLEDPSYFESIGVRAPGFTTSDAVSLFASTSFLYRLGIMICVVGAGIMYARAGFIRMKASEAAVRKSNEEIRRTTLGLLGVLSLFVILYTFNRDLLTGTVSLTEWRTRGVQGGAPLVGTTTQRAPSTQPFIPQNNDDPAGWNAIRDDQAVRDRLAALPNGGITVYGRVCTTPTQTSCTTVGGWPPETPAMLAQLRGACPGRIAVTGGTEAGHSSHGPGRSAVDISKNDSQLENCIRSFPVSSRRPRNRFGGDLCYRVYENFGFIFCDEISNQAHWHAYKP